jgi:hypothetical protein
MHVPRELHTDETPVSDLRRLRRLRLLKDEDEIARPALFLGWCASPVINVHMVETEKGRVGISDCLFKYGNLEDGEPLGIQKVLRVLLHY